MATVLIPDILCIWDCDGWIIGSIIENNSHSKVMAEQRRSAEEQQRTTVRMVRGTHLGEMFA
jgi:hypothetical protein